MTKQNERNPIRQLIHQQNEEIRWEFKELGFEEATFRYTDKQKDFAMNLAQEKGVRATARILGLQRKTIQRWLRAKGVWVKRCPDWVYDWAYWRRKKREKWERIRAYRGY